MVVAHNKTKFMLEKITNMRVLITRLNKKSFTLSALYHLDIYSPQLLFLLRDTLLMSKIQNSTLRFENPSEKY